MSGPRLSIIPGDFIDDDRARLIHYQTMTQLGRRTNRAGWCMINQTKLARHLGVARQTVSTAVNELVRWGYVEKRSQSQTGRNICFYRVILDRGDPCAGPRNLPPDCGVDDADCDPEDVSSQGDTSPGDVSATGDTSVAPEDDTSVAPGDDTITIPHHNDPPLTTKRARSGARARAGVDDLISRVSAVVPAEVIEVLIEPVVRQLRIDAPDPAFALIEIGRQCTLDRDGLDAACRKLLAERGATAKPSDIAKAIAAAQPASEQRKAERAAQVLAEQRSPELASRWRCFAAELRRVYGDDGFRSWFAEVFIEADDGNTLVLSAPTKGAANWIGTRLVCDGTFRLAQNAAGLRGRDVTVVSRERAA